MNDDQPPASFLIGAQIRRASSEGVPITVRKRGHETIGSIILKINRLDGTAHVLSQVRMGDETCWNPLTRTDPMPDAEAEKALSRQADFDPDVWIVEIEDKQGRAWFPGKILKL